MKIDREYNSPVSNTVRKVMITDLLHTLDRMMKDPDEAKELKENGVTAFVVKGSAANCLAEPPQGAITRNPRDLDLIAIGSVANDYSDRRTYVYDTIERAAALSGFGAERGSLETMRERMVSMLHTKAKSKATMPISREWLDSAIARQEELHLTDRDVHFLEQAKNDIGKAVSLKIDVAVNHPIQDMPPHGLDGKPLTEGVGVHDPHISLIDKLQAANFVMRGEEYRPMTHATDILDVYNLSKRFPGGLSDEDKSTIENVLQTGPVYRHRQFLQVTETTANLLAHADLRFSSWAGVGLRRDKARLTKPTPEQITALKRDLDAAYDANLIGERVSPEQIEQMLEVSHQLSHEVFGKKLERLNPIDPTPETSR